MLEIFSISPCPPIPEQVAQQQESTDLCFGYSRFGPRWSYRNQQLRRRYCNLPEGKCKECCYVKTVNRGCCEPLCCRPQWVYTTRKWQQPCSACYDQMVPVPVYKCSDCRRSCKPGL